VDDILNNIHKKIEEIKQKSSYDINEKFSFTIILSLNGIELQKKILEKMFEKVIINFKDDFYYLPFIIILVDNQPDIQTLEKFLEDKNLLEGIDKRNISYFIKTDSLNIKKKNR